MMRTPAPSALRMRLARSRLATAAPRRLASSSSSSGTEKAQNALRNAWTTTQRFLGPLGERVGSMLGCTSLRARTADLH